MYFNKKINQRTVFLSLALLFISLSGLRAQGPGLEKSITGINAGLTGFLSHERRLTPTISSRIDAGFLYNRIGKENLWFPYVELQQRWYYNFKKREEKSKNTRGNSGNFISATILYSPQSSQLFGNKADAETASVSSIGSYWGLRRQFWKRFSFEFMLGVAWTRTFYSTPKDETGAYLNFNFGYNFYRE